MLAMILVMPIIQLIMLVNAATFEVKNLKVFFVDSDGSSTSQLLKSKFENSDYFITVGTSHSRGEAEMALKTSSADLFIEIPPEFEKNLIRENSNKIQISVNAIDGSKASLAMSYSISTIASFNQEILQRYPLAPEIVLSPEPQMKVINIVTRHWYNPELNYKFFMVPGILVLLVTLIGVFLSAMNLVREKEIGTIEQINVTPIHKYQFIIGKLLPMWILGMFELIFGMTLGILMYHVPFVGSLMLLLLFSGLYLIAMCGFGLLVSTITNTQQQAMFLSWFFMVLFILLSGLFTSTDNMPDWIQYITIFNPIKYFIEVVRMVMLKGSGFSDVRVHFIAMLAFAIGINFVAVLRYRKTM